MSNVLVEESSLQNIADAIRGKNKSTDKYKPSEMATAINNIQTLNGGGYKVNITQSEHQTITVSQSSFNNRTTMFTIDDYPSINVSLKADPGYIAGSLNRTNFTFSNDVREVDIFATEATAVPNTTYNGNMNVIKSGSSFNITSASSYDSGNHYNEAFDLELFDLGDTQIYELRINYKDNFYSLDPETEYRITALKIGDTSLSSDDLADGRPILSTVSAHINADLSKDWVKSVYKQCTGKELIKEINLSDFPSADQLDSVMQQSGSLPSQGRYVGEQIADRLYKSEIVSFAIVNAYINKYDTSEFFKTLSSDKQTEFADSVEFFMTSYETSTTGLRDGNLIQNYFNVLKQIKDRYANDTTATTILEKYDPLKNNIFLDATLNGTSIDIFEIVYKIDSSNTYGFTSSLNGGLAYVLWVFYVYYIIIIIILVNTEGFTPADPIISTIPVSITFTNVTQ